DSAIHSAALPRRGLGLVFPAERRTAPNRWRGRCSDDATILAQGLEERVEAWRPRLERARFERQETKPRARPRPLALAQRRRGEEDQHGEEGETEHLRRLSP